MNKLTLCYVVFCLMFNFSTTVRTESISSVPEVDTSKSVRSKRATKADNLDNMRKHLMREATKVLRSLSRRTSDDSEVNIASFIKKLILTKLFFRTYVKLVSQLIKW